MRIIFGFPTDPRKINKLIQTVDQEVGGSNPPSCTNDLARSVGNVWEMAFSCFVLLCLPMCNTLFGNPTRGLDRRHDVVLTRRVDVAMLRVLGNIL
jgi:hypothetical protein